jgi:hypothetical protein
VSIVVTSRVLLYYVCIAVPNTLGTGLLARSQDLKGTATGKSEQVLFLSRVCKRRLSLFPIHQFATDATHVALTN